MGYFVDSCELASNVVRPGAFFMLPIVHKTIHVWI